MPAPQLGEEVYAETLQLWEKHGRNFATAAIEAGLNLHTFKSRVRAARGRLGDITQFDPGGIGAGNARDGLDPFVVKGVSTYFDRDGQQVGQWVKTKIDEQRRLAMLQEAIAERCERITPLPLIPLAKPELLTSKLVNLVTVTDYHIGMLAWHRETGGDWDITIARETFRRCFGGLITSMPEAGTCVINQLGDLLHTDGMIPITPGHANVLDADSRYQKMASVAADLLEELVLMALEKHAKVHVIMAEGNHDESGSAWLRIMFRRIFRDNPRVTVDDSPLPYYAVSFGKVMLAFHHGHKLKPAQLPALFAGEPRFRKQWGEAEFCYGHCGHQHHLDEKEHSGMIVMQHPTLAERDAYAARGGWIAERRAIGITYHADRGEAWRTYVTPAMFEEEK